MFLALSGQLFGMHGRKNPHGYNPPRSKLGRRLEGSEIKV